MINDAKKLDDQYKPNSDTNMHKTEFENVYNKLPKYLQKTVREMRELLWWREELRDISTRYYYLIRLYTLELAKTFQKNKVLANYEDIWYLKICDIKNFIDGKITANDLAIIINNNKNYYECFRNFTPENEIGQKFNMQRNEKIKSGLGGLGCSYGTVTGPVRLINDISHINEIKADDILVTKFTDTGWTSKFSILSGVVTEYGGILCHAAIVSREYGIPCVVCASDIMNKLKTGDIITINGSTGEIIKSEI